MTNKVDAMEEIENNAMILSPKGEMITRGLYIKTYGCQMNVYDSAKMSDLLRPHGFTSVQSVDDADMVILNTCNVREKAAEKVYSELGRIAQIKRSKAGNMVVVVAGCVAQAEGEEVVRRAPCVDVIVGPQSYHNLPELLEQAKRKKSWVLDLSFQENAKFDKLLPDSGVQGVSAHISVQEGCDKFCHFCSVPYTRGAEYSRPVSQIYREVAQAVAMGAKEITLVGQNVSAYHGDGNDGKPWSLGLLIKHIAKISDLQRLRYTTSHPRDMDDDELFDAHANEPKLMPFVHLPIQSGSNRMLKAMNRKHTWESYVEVIEKFTDARKDIALSSDFIVGYPGETDQDFRYTLAIVNAVGYAQAYSFKYSPRPGTPASSLENQVSEEVKTDRLLVLQDLIRLKQLEFNRKSIGQEYDVLFDKAGKGDGQLMGKSPYLQSVVVNSDTNMINQIAKVKIYEAGQNSLKGEITNM